jgi:Fe-S oxidoreductase
MTALPKPVARELIAATDLCTFCPNLCLHACPVATAESSTTVAPWAKMLLARWLSTGEARLTLEAAATLQHCTNCGACMDACVHHVPVGATLRTAVTAIAAIGMKPVAPTDPPVESDDGTPLPDGVSGAALLAAGHVDRFRAVATAAAGRWRSRATLVFASLSDYGCVADDYPAHGITVTASLQVEAASGMASPPIDGPAGWFEPCSLARSERLDRRSVKAAAEVWAGRPLTSLRWEGATATCCGAGGSYALAAPEGAREAARRILQNAIDRGLSTLVVPCSGCAAHFQRSSDGLPIVIRRS